MADVMDALMVLDRDEIMSRLAEELPEIRKTLKVELEEFADKTGIQEDRLKDIESGSQTMIWSEYMSVIFVIWNNSMGRGILEKKGLFPDTLKKAMSLNRNAHRPPFQEEQMHM